MDPVQLISTNSWKWWPANSSYVTQFVYIDDSMKSSFKFDENDYNKTESLSLAFITVYLLSYTLKFFY